MFAPYATENGVTSTKLYFINTEGNKIETDVTRTTYKNSEYNDLNQLVRVDEYDGVVIRYSYDGLGNRVQQDISQTYTLWETEAKQVKQRMKKLQDKLAFLDEHDYCIAYFYGESDLLANLEDEYTYYYKTKEVTEEKVSYPSKSTSITYVNDMTQVYSEVVSEKQEGSITNYYYGNKRIQSNERIYVYDGMGNVIQDVSPSGALLESYEYSAYGERNIQYNPFLKNSSYGYRGEAHTYDNKQYLRARYYDVHSENFIQEDSYRGTQDDVASRNRYNYAQNNPYKYSDPSGHDAFSAFGSASGGSGYKFISVYSMTATLLHVDKLRVAQVGCSEVLLYNNKLYTGKYNGANYVDGIKQKSSSSGSITNSTTNPNYKIQDDIIVATFTPTVIKVNAPKLDMSELSRAAINKVRETSKALGVLEEILRQFLLADLDNSRSKLERGYSLSDRVIGLCDAYLARAEKYYAVGQVYKDVGEEADALYKDYWYRSGKSGKLLIECDIDGKLYGYIQKDRGKVPGYTYMELENGDSSRDICKPNNNLL